ncbi:MAG TPA: alpha/beta hydrolase [Jatrophihabitans sp.]|jgi:pimeloyl-ACP methyl ester carboxylesterase|uniref:alpha/beta fold hydrolase n=1 Tax=Jatrophihabitans sp. TaxID=1932789 RepID=UPI002F18D546
MTTYRLTTITASDGRALGVAQWGDPDGDVVFSLHGTPGSRFGRPPDEAGLERARLRLVTYDRPGYGVSDRRPGRRVVDCAEDVAAIADALGIDRFAVTGGSGGGPHALAVAARLGNRLTRVECRVGAAPFDAEGLDWWAGMDPRNVQEFHWAIEGEQVLHDNLARLAGEDLARIAQDPSKILSDDWQLADADREKLARPDLQQVFVEDMRNAYSAGVWGWVDDDLAFVTDWGFNLDQIEVPVTVRYGAHDVLVPAGHGAWLASHVPGATVVVHTEGGHLSDPDTRIEELRALVATG